MAVQTTQRAYTLRLKGTPEAMDALWKTHVAVNRGVKAFGDWLLTLRGGLSHELATEKVREKARPARTPTPQEVHDRRIVLALSWLSVESEDGAPKKRVIPANKTVETLRTILKGRGLKSQAVEDWVADCQDTLKAAIRDDAVWVNRSAAFDDLRSGQRTQPARDDAEALLTFLFTDDYLRLPRSVKSPKNRGEGLPEETGAPTERVEQRTAVVKSGKGAGQRTRHPFSHLFPSDDRAKKGFGNPASALKLRGFWEHYLRSALGSSCRIPIPSGKQTYDRSEGEVSPMELHREMFSKTAARLAQIHTKQKQQEIEREQTKHAVGEFEMMERDTAYSEAIHLLDDFCANFGTSTGARSEFRLAPRQIQGWGRVISYWAQMSHSDPVEAESARVEAVRRLQREMDEGEKKFGDANLFASLAAERYRPVWLHSGRPDDSILRTYVRGMKARSDSEFLKVAAYRHPNECSHPVFCQFGVSRPRIEHERLNPNPTGEDTREVRMLTWDGTKARLLPLRAVSKRLDCEIGTAQESATAGQREESAVTRRTRLGIAAGAPKPDMTPRVSHVFDTQKVRSRKPKDGTTSNEEQTEKEPSWNGTLTADRDELKRKREHPDAPLRWWLIISMELAPRGPILDYERNLRKPILARLQSRQRGEDIVALGPGKPRYAWRGLAFPIDHPAGNDNRAWNAWHILDRLPGLRILSVDLGHRYAAACAVWETMTSAQVANACEEAGAELPNAEALYLHLRHDGKKTVYRRIGPDIVPGGKPHPAPWARLDRQFLVRLQGEVSPARWATPEEVERVKEFETWCGWISPDKRDWRDRHVDQLMSHAVAVARLALRRHADRARIAFAMDSDHKILPGDRAYFWTAGRDHFPDGPEERQEKRKEFIRDALVTWHGLATSSAWRDEHAGQLWSRLRDLGAPNLGVEDATLSRSERKKRNGMLEEQLFSVAEKLLQKVNDGLRAKLHLEWEKRWKDADGLPGITPEVNMARKRKGQSRLPLRTATGWYVHLRRLADWMIPTKGPNSRQVGGLSLTRLTTIQGFRRAAQVGFFTRLRPDGTKAVLAERFGDHMLLAVERMKENRVKQLASRIAEAALGIGKEQAKVGGRDPKRPRVPTNPVCHAVVIENLDNYRPDELQTRRENRQLMQWSSGKVRNFLTEACQLHGLHLREVYAGYTSQQDSRTGAPGVRCTDKPGPEFRKWFDIRQKRLNEELLKLKKKSSEKPEGKARVAELEYLWKAYQRVLNGADRVRVRERGGSIFVSADPNSPAANGLQADLNAAANIGLRALLDPDWPGKWWWVPCDKKTGKPDPEKTKGAEPFETLPQLFSPAKSKDDEKEARGKSREIINLWRDVSTEPIGSSDWKDYKEYWNGVRARVIAILRKQNGLRDRANVGEGNSDADL